MEIDASNNESRLSRIETLWSVVRQAHDGTSDQRALDAQRALLDQYSLAIRRYLHGALRDRHLADDVFQDFAVKFVSGELRNADPSRGRFRAFVKTVLYRMIADTYRRQARRAERALPTAQQPEIADDAGKADDEAFLLSWRESLLDRTWQTLAEHESQTGTRYYSVLKLRVSQPELSGNALAESLSQMMKKPIQPGAARVLVHRSRDKFARLLIEAVRESLDDASDEAVQEELSELRLLSYCQGAFEPNGSTKSDRSV